MSRVVINRDDADSSWDVWITLDDHDPLHDPFGFIVGSGETAEAAIADAVEDLESVIARLHKAVAVPRAQSHG